MNRPQPYIPPITCNCHMYYVNTGYLGETRFQHDINPDCPIHTEEVA